MMGPEDREAFLAVTTCDELQTARIGRKLREELDRMRAARLGAREATEAHPSVVHRVRRRLAEGDRPSRVRPLGLGMLVAAAAVAVAAFAVGSWSAGEGTDAIASGDVSLALEGEGTVGGTREAPEIRWESGTLRVAVTPQRGVKLSVVTPEGTVRVIGTAFSVDRADFATEVVVSHGTVEVTCTGDEPVRVPAPGTRRCLPDDAATLLRRVTALRRSGADPDLRLEAIDAGLASADRDGPIEAELRAHRAELLAGIGRTGDAMKAARAYLRTEGPRTAEMVELLVALGEDRCAALAELPGASAADRATCVADRAGAER